MRDRAGAHLCEEELRLVELAGALRLVLAAGEGNCIVVAGVPGGGHPAAQVKHSTALQLSWEGGKRILSLQANSLSRSFSFAVAFL